MGGKRKSVSLPSQKTQPVHEGSRFGKLTCIRRETMEAHGVISPAWRCRCSCGNVVLIRESLLRCGIKKSCGCTANRARDLTNMRFGRLVALEPVPVQDTDSSIRWLCLCDCGEYVTISSNKLLTGHTKSCGCYGDEIRGDGRTFIDGTCLEIIASDKLPKDNTSGHKGVARYRNQWQAYICYAGKQYSFGHFDDIKRAVAIRKGAEKLRLDFVQKKLDGQDLDTSFRQVLETYLREEREIWNTRPLVLRSSPAKVRCPQ